MYLVETCAKKLVLKQIHTTVSTNDTRTLPVWRDKRLTTDPVVMRSSPAIGHKRCALLVNQPN